MIYTLDIETYYLLNKMLLFLVSILSVWIGSWVYLSNKRKNENKLFLLMSVFTILWPAFGYLTYFSTQAPIAIFWAKLAYATVSLFTVAFYFFFSFFLKEEKRFRIFSIFVLLGGVFFVIISIFTNLVVKNIKIKEIGVNPVFSYGTYLFYIFVFVIFLFILSRLYINYFIFPKSEKTKIQYFFIGTSIFLILNTVFNIILPIVRGNFEFHQFGNYAAIFFLVFTAYAITKHNLMGIKTLLTQTLIIIISIILLLDIFTLSDNLTMQLLKAGILVAFLYFSKGMIKSVKKEHQAREELQKTYRKVNRYAKKLEKANQNLEELLESKDDFMHITSHQLRTPLTVIRGMLAMWRAGDFDGLSEKGREKMKEKIYLSAERLNNITNDMLDAMEVEGKFLKFNLEFVSLENIIRDVMDELKPNYDKKKLYLKLNIKGKLPKIKLEPKYFKQALMNLLDNAEKYTPRGGVEINVYPAVFKKGEKSKFALIEIKDTGIGISKRDQKKLFQKFSRTGNAIKQNTTGSGLGLFIAKQIIDEHEGKIEISSEGVGKGAAVRVWLPR